MVVAQLLERSLPTLEIRSSNPVIGRFYQIVSNLYWKDLNIENRGREWPIKNILTYLDNMMNSEAIHTWIDGHFQSNQDVIEEFSAAQIKSFLQNQTYLMVFVGKSVL